MFLQYGVWVINLVHKGIKIQGGNMEIVNQLLANKILGVALISWFIAQSTQIILTLIIEHRFAWWKIFQSKGMPSSNSALVSALAVGVGQAEGYNSLLFTIATVFAFIVMYDAANVRLEAGKQAALLNKMIEILHDDNIMLDKPLKEFMGNTRAQVVVGAMLGVVTVFVFKGI